MKPKLNTPEKIAKELLWWNTRFLEKRGVKPKAALKQATAISEEFTAVVHSLVANEMFDLSYRYFKLVNDALGLRLEINNLDMEDLTPEYFVELIGYHFRKAVRLASRRR